MKKLRIYLSIAAVVCAVGATFATRSTDMIVGYEYIPGMYGEPELCVQRMMYCAVSGPVECTMNNHEVRKDNILTHCGPELRRLHW
ncbi:MAG TPA: DUF6520 family protein [Ohtaekwangia sp.]|nr:DUF6520 family protein [Ohtaekwangia sp.]